jgi:hypothetical protein
MNEAMLGHWIRPGKQELNMKQYYTIKKSVQATVTPRQRGSQDMLDAPQEPTSGRSILVANLLTMEIIMY